MKPLYNIQFIPIQPNDIRELQIKTPIPASPLIIQHMDNPPCIDDVPIKMPVCGENSQPAMLTLNTSHGALPEGMRCSGGSCLRPPDSGFRNGKIYGADGIPLEKMWNMWIWPAET